MSKSPYDSLTTGDNNIKPSSAPRMHRPEAEKPIKSHMEYVEVPLEELVPGEAPKSTTQTASQKNTTPLSTPPQYSRLNIKNMSGTNSFTMPFEESLLVPDTMADMEQVLFAEGHVDLSQPLGKNYGTDDFLTGKITIFTVYRPTTGSRGYSAGAIDVVKSTIPFKTDKCWINSKGDTFTVAVSLGGLIAEMVNERKFVVRGDILIKISGVSAKELKTFKAPGDGDLIVRTSHISATELLHETTETTEISQEITVKEGEPAPIKILKESFDICESHRQITSGKLVVHGVIQSQVLYMGLDAKLACLSSKIDFTQFILLKENVDPDMIMIHFCSEDLNMTIENRDKFLLSGNVLSHIQVYGNRQIDMVTDAYHKKNDLVYDVDTQPVNSVIGAVNGDISSREVINLSEGDRYPETLLCGSCEIAGLDAHFENDNSVDNNRIIIEGTLPVNILAVDESGDVFTINSQIPVRGALSMSLTNKTSSYNESVLASPKLHMDSSIRNFWFTQINNRQIEVNITLAVTVWALHEGEFCTLENLRFAEESESARLASMAIYVVNYGDTLWDIAKRYKSDVDILAETNGLARDEAPAEGTKLFISR